MYERAALLENGQGLYLNDWLFRAIDGTGTITQRYLFLPFTVSLISALYYTIQTGRDRLLKFTQRHRSTADTPFTSEPTASSIVARNGGAVVFSWMLARVIGCLVLTTLSAFILLEDAPRMSWNFFTHFHSVNDYLNHSLVLSNFYALTLAASALFVQESRRKPLIRHNIAILLSQLAVYTYRDLWPLAIYSDRPSNVKDGWILWTRIGVLVFLVFVIPLCTPSVYTPVDPKSPAVEVNPEQTASILSWATFTYLSPIISAANKLGTVHLGPDQMPPLADYDNAQVLAKRSFPIFEHIELGKSPHIGFPLLRLFASDYLISTIAMTVNALSQFAAPLAINRLLALVESNESQPVGSIRPWFWVASLFVLRIVGSIGFQCYASTMTHSLTQADSILTQLIFSYSLRMRGMTMAESKPTMDEAECATSKRMQSRNSGSNLVGKLNNLATVDLNNIIGARDLVVVFWQLPLQIIISSIFLYVILGWSAFVGLGLMVALFPVPGYLASMLRSVQVEKMKKTDNRTQTVTESMSVLRTIKMFGWERKIQEKIDQRREEELYWVWKGKLLNLFVLMVTYLIPTVTMVATYGTAALIMKIELTASKIFSSMIVFDTLRGAMQRANYYLVALIKGKVSLDRFDEFFKETETLPLMRKTKTNPLLTDESAVLAAPRPSDCDNSANTDRIYFRNATFSWSAVEESPGHSGSTTPSSSSPAFKLCVPDELQFMEGKITLITGPTGSGKTSLLMALLGEMYFTPSHPDSAFNLPRAGGVALAVQESWVQNQTIRENIVFNSPFDEERYQKVLYQCALKPDLEIFEAGDLTEVGERGLTLSGGQKARVTLARAIYSSAKIILLDDVLAALDVHTAKWVANKCLKGDLVEGRTVVLVTHNVALVRPIADFIVSVSPEGIVTCKDFKSELLVSVEDDTLSPLPSEVVTPNAPCQTSNNASGKLIVAEEIHQGHIGWKAMKLFFQSLGGRHPFRFFFLWISGHFISYCMLSFNLWFLGYWSSQYKRHRPEEVPAASYLGAYVGLTLLFFVLSSSKDLWFILGTMRASKFIHRILTSAVLGSTLRWFDETPVSRVLARMTQDIQSIDGALMLNAENFVNLILLVLVDLVSAVLFVPLFLLPGLLIAGLGMYIGARYMRAQLSVKREMSNAKAPVLAHFSASMVGLVSIRAYGVEEAFKKELQVRLDHYVRMARLNYDLNRWIGIRLDALGAAFIASLAAYLTYASTINAANVGFSLNRAVEFTSMLLYVVRVFNLFQVEANSLERIVSYVEIEQEPKPTQKGKPAASWPTSGEIRVENLTARYSKSGPAVLHDISFYIRAGERVGVVGRTGSGKSSLTLALLRCIPIDGTVYFDGLATKDVNLESLRSNITIIPQSPELLSGTLRYNLDPFDEYDDATLNAALKASGLYALRTDSDVENRLGLDSAISNSGLNLSAGQRQIIALARAIVRSSKLLILDEATSAIDHETDAIIQNTLRTELGSDVTVLTIAHRLQTIIDADRIMVLDSGRIVEFSTPAELLGRDKGALKAMVDECGDKGRLYDVAKQKTYLSSS